MFLILGHAKIIDKFLSDPRASYHETVVRDEIVFHDEENYDPDWKVRQCYLLLIASATEIVCGFALLHPFVGLKKSIGMRIHVMFLGMFFYHVFLASTANGSV